MTGRRVGLATCREFPDLDEDDRLVLPALTARGIEGVPLVWSDPATDWAGVDLTVVRSTWDYPERREPFLRWTENAERAGGLLNRPSLIAWNTDKRYLQRLADAGIPVVPTTYLAPGEEPSLPSVGDVVIKPSISAGSRDTARYRTGEDDQAALSHIARLHAAGRHVMVQPYLDAVDAAGETAMLFIDGAWSHAVRKGPLLRPGQPPTEALFAQEDISPRTPTAAQHAVAEAAIAVLPEEDWLYARVDLLDSVDGPLVLELELIEPTLFLRTSEGAADRFATAIARRLR